MNILLTVFPQITSSCQTEPSLSVQELDDLLLQQRGIRAQASPHCLLPSVRRLQMWSQVAAREFTKRLKILLRARAHFLEDKCTPEKILTAFNFHAFQFYCCKCNCL